jgi:hippurate hydrolase
VNNDAQLTAAAAEIACNFIGEKNVLETELRMGAEDFGYYTQIIPGCFFRLGVRNEQEGIIHNVHTSRFNIDETAIEIGMGAMACMGAFLKA